MITLVTSEAKLHPSIEPSPIIYFSCFVYRNLIFFNSTRQREALWEGGALQTAVIVIYKSATNITDIAYGPNLRLHTTEVATT